MTGTMTPVADNKQVCLLHGSVLSKAYVTNAASKVMAQDYTPLHQGSTGIDP